MKYLSAVCIVALLSLTACSSGTDSNSDSQEKTTLTVFAAASLTEVFADVAEEFSAVEPDVDVRFSFAGSSDLVAQISEGAPADVIATADESTMNTLNGDDLLTGEPSVFASNTLTLAVPSGNPGSIETWNGTNTDDGQLVDTLTPRASVALDKNRTLTRAEPVWSPTEHSQAWRAVWQYRRKRAIRDRETLNLQRNRAMRVIDGESKPKAARFVRD